MEIHIPEFLSHLACIWRLLDYDKCYIPYHMLMSNLKHKSIIKSQVFILNYENAETHKKVITN